MHKCIKLFTYFVDTCEYYNYTYTEIYCNLANRESMYYFSFQPDSYILISRYMGFFHLHK